MSVYEELEMRPVINAYATLTRLGGSIMPPEVLEAMNEAARYFIDLDELQRRVGQRLAKLTRNEAAYVSSGAAAGLTLATAACIAGTDPEAARALGRLRAASACADLSVTASRDRDPAVRAAAVEALGRTGSEDAPSAVREALEQDDDRVRAAAARALG